MARPKKIQGDVQAELLAGLAIGMNIGDACGLAGVNRATYHRMMNTDEAFAKKVRRAKASYMATIHSKAYEAAVKDGKLAFRVLIRFWDAEEKRKQRKRQENKLARFTEEELSKILSG